MCLFTQSCFRFSTREATASSPAIAHTASKPGSSGVGVVSGVADGAGDLVGAGVGVVGAAGETTRR